KSWRDTNSPPFFTLWPSGGTRITVPIPLSNHDLRIPFVWGTVKRSPLQRLSPRLHVRLSNLLTTLRNSRSVDGWSDPYGYLPDGTTFGYITNPEPGTATTE